MNENGFGKKEIDGQGIATNQALVRAERSGKGNGRLYHITFIARHDKGAESAGKPITISPIVFGKTVISRESGKPTRVEHIHSKKM